MAGYIKLHRRIRDHWVWEDPEKFRAWTDLLMSASHKPVTKLVGGKIISIPRGGLAASERYLSDRWKWSTTKVRNFLRNLALEQMIKREKKQGCSILILLNYESYNSQESTKEAPLEAQTVAEEKQRESENKKGKKGRETKKERVTHAPEREAWPSTIAEAVAMASEWMIHEDVVHAWHDNREACGWVNGKGLSIRDWRADLRSFARSWSENAARRSHANAKGYSIGSEGGDTARLRKAILSGDREPYANRGQRPWMPRVNPQQRGKAWGDLMPKTRERIVREMEEEGINITAA